MSSLQISFTEEVPRVYFDRFVFDRWDKYAAYALGLFYGDGDLYKNNDKLFFRFHNKEKRNVELVKELIQSQAVIGQQTSKYVLKTGLVKGSTTYHFGIQDQDFIKHLQGIGIKRNHGEYEFPNIPEEFQLDFIRGYSEVKGYFMPFGNPPRLRINGPKNVIKKIQLILHGKVGMGLKRPFVNPKNDSFLQLNYSRTDDLLLFVSKVYGGQNMFSCYPSRIVAFNQWLKILSGKRYKRSKMGL